MHNSKFGNEFAGEAGRTALAHHTPMAEPQAFRWAAPTPLDRETPTPPIPFSGRPVHLSTVAAGPGSAGTRALRPVLAAGSRFLATASGALVRVKQLWNRVPRPIRDWVHAALDATGVPYALNYIAGYEATYQVDNFAGNLIELNAAYASSSPEQREKLAWQCKRIVDALVMRNGVSKSTHPMRQNRILMKVLTDTGCRLRTSAIKVLELPSSTGVAALDNYAALSQYYRIRAYVLGDLFFQLRYDTDRQCIFDEEFTLLQVKMKKRFFSIHRPARSGERHTLLTAVLLFPFELVSRYLKAKYAYAEARTTIPIPLVHPYVEARIRTGDLTVKTMDVFHKIGDRYDVILCFNLLLRRYFPLDQIAQGIENLKDALREDGLLIMGDEESYAVARKRDGQLVFFKKEGRF